ncbi:MAG: prepilin-type N-terminal cleavage/methylation domain-containing protein [Clostridiaceae bacterium]|nr:prepilin-type N-terminal cleavage/methylation domain-containing protein [Clostridiaceae bacterium]
MKKKGFTLIEMMIALAIFSLFVGFLYKAYFSQIKENKSFIDRLDLKYNGDKAMGLITDELRSNVIQPDIDIITSPSTGNITQIKSNPINLIDLTGTFSNSDLQLTSQNTLVSNPSLNNVVQCKGIKSITMKYNVNLILITIELKSKNDEYTVTSAVNIKN